MARGPQEHGIRASHPPLGTDGPDGDAPDRPGQEPTTGFIPVPEMIRQLAVAQPATTAVICGRQRLDYGGLESETVRIASWLLATGHRHGDRVALLASPSVAYVTAIVAALRAGLVAVPLAPSATPEALLAMIADAGAKTVFADVAGCALLGLEPRPGLGLVLLGRTAELDESVAGAARDGSAAARLGPLEIGPQAPFNIIYSSGTTGTPKGIVQPHGMRWSHVDRARLSDYGPGCVTLLSTPLYSNTTLVSFFPTIALGGTVVLMDRFDSRRFLELAEEHRPTHAMLVPVQYRRLMDEPSFDRFDLGSFRQKFCTSAPFAAGLKREVLDRWPGGLTEYYGMTEGGGTCMLKAHLHPDKLHTVGQPVPGHDIRLVDDAGHAVGRGEAGEVVGRSPAMMLGYHNRVAQTRETEWFDAAGHRFIRTGDVGRFDDDGFLVLMDRKKDMIISGGFNIYPSDLELVLSTHPEVAEAAVVGVPSDRWGETPVAWVVLRAAEPAAASGEQAQGPQQAGGEQAPGQQGRDEQRAEPQASPDQVPDLQGRAAAIRDWVNAKVGKTQRLADLIVVEALPRGTIGKVLKRELRDSYGQAAAPGPP